MHYSCLIVDDEIELAKATCEYFEMFNTSCKWVGTAEECEEFLEKNTIDILLLDINLEKESGFELCKRIRQTFNFPILFISARQSDDDILIALNIGGDDYIKKPYSLSVLLAKVNVILKRQKERSVGYNHIDYSGSGNKSLNDKGLSNTGLDNKNLNNENVNTGHAYNNAPKRVRIDDNTMRVYVGEREAALKAKEYKLFSYLYHNANRIISKDELFHAVWGDAFYSDGTLNVHIRKLREKLEENPNEPVMIKTVWGTGYILEL